MREKATGRLRAVGFWFPATLARMRAVHGSSDAYVKFLAEEHEAEARSGKPFLPDPDRIISILGPASYDERVVRYLELGTVIRSYMGFSTCRCCGLFDSDMGTTDLTDGIWIWPEGLAHYLRRHSLPLPDEFLHTIAEHDYRVPRIDTKRVTYLREGDDYTYWHNWTAKVYAVGPNP